MEDAELFDVVMKGYEEAKKSIPRFTYQLLIKKFDIMYDEEYLDFQIEKMHYYLWLLFEIDQMLGYPDFIINMKNVRKNISYIVVLDKPVYKKDLQKYFDAIGNVKQCYFDVITETDFNNTQVLLLPEKEQKNETGEVKEKLPDTFYGGW